MGLRVNLSFTIAPIPMSDFLKVGELKENLVRLIETRFELTKLEVQDRIEGLVVKAVYTLISFILGIMVFVFLGILLAIGINEWLESTWIGFLILFLFNLLILIVFFLAKEFILSNLKKEVQQIFDKSLGNE
jgi:hypothetical protein